MPVRVAHSRWHLYVKPRLLDKAGRQLAPQILHKATKVEGESMKTTRLTVCHPVAALGLGLALTVALLALAWHDLDYWVPIAACVVGLLIMALSASVARAALARHQKLWQQHRAYAETEQLLASMSSILIGVDEHDRITRWNTAAERTFGIAPAEAVGRSFCSSGIPWDTPGLLAHLTACRRTHQPLHLNDVRCTRPDGKEGFLNLTLSPVQGDLENSPGVLLLGLDTTEHKLLESQLVQAQKLEAMGQLAAGIAHEINTPTQYVGDNTRFLQDAFGDLARLLEQYTALFQAVKAGTVADALLCEVAAMAEEVDTDYLTAEIPQAIQQSLEGVERIASIVRAMKEFAHPGTEEKTPIDLNRAIANALTVTRNEWKYVAELSTDFEPALPLVPCVPGGFNQVILNIIVNAAHAMADVVDHGSAGKGTLTITTRQQGDWAEIRISDTGSGIPEAVRSKVFDPFFTTKEVGKGTGQGLAISYDVVVNKHGGTLTFETEMDRGTTFIIRLPIGTTPQALGETR